LLLRIFQYILDANPVRELPVPKRRADSDTVLRQTRRRALTTEEAGQLFGRIPPVSRVGATGILRGDPLLEAVDLPGAHDLRHTFGTWRRRRHPGEGDALRPSKKIAA
jgi:hypothetical protein